MPVCATRDWGRYIPASTPKRGVMLAAFASQIATLIPFFFGLVIATLVATHAPNYIKDNNYVIGLLAISPTWLFLPVCLIALIGGFSTGTTSLYGTGLDMSSVFTRLSRTGDAADRHRIDRVHFSRQVRSEPRRKRLDVRRSHHHLHDAVDGDHGARLSHASRLLQGRRPAGLHARTARRRVLVSSQLELAWSWGMDSERRTGLVHCERTRAVCRPPRQSCRRRRYQSARHDGACRDVVSKPASTLS